MDSFQRLWPKSGKVDYDRWKVISMCVLAATTFWFFSALNKADYTTSLNYPIKLIYPGGDSLMVVGELPKSLRISVTGGGWNLFRKSFGIGTKPLEVNLSTPTETRYLLGSSLSPLINDQITSFRLNSVITDTLHFHLENQKTRDIRVAVKEINPGMDYMVIGDVQIDPDSIEVTGPESYILALADSVVLEVTRKNITGAYQDDIEIVLDGEQLVADPSEVSVGVQVDPMTDQQYVASVDSRNIPDGYLIQADSNGYLINYRIAASYVDSVGNDDIQLFADFEAMQPDSTIQLKAISNHPFIRDLKVDSLFLPVVKIK